MPRRRTVFLCTECGADHPSWSGRCPSCGAWNTLVEERLEQPGRSPAPGRPAPTPVPVGAIPAAPGSRLLSGIAELDRVFGGGIFRGSVNLLGGEPGIGKSTMMLQLAAALAEAGETVLYATGEESAEQVAERARRTGSLAGRLLVVPATALGEIAGALSGTGASILVVDSIQTIFSDDLSGAPGSVAQVRHCASEIVGMCKPSGVTAFLVGHVTKDGMLAGPKVLEHLVDSVVAFEGDAGRGHRMLRAVKNRFGSTNELGLFRMGAQGLEEVPDPTGIFIADRDASVPGSCVVPTIDGNRCLLVEVQALVNPTDYPQPVRKVSGMDPNRVAMVLAVLSRRLRLPLGTADVFVNVTGGARIAEPAADLAVAAAIASGLQDKPCNPAAACCGEIGLAGELRAISDGERRIREAVHLGFKSIVLPESNTRELKPSLKKLPIKIHGCRTLHEAL
ncbi:DNA repair protein RadA, partial [Candidatus Fermentibacteria bacterium]|nr:DNA repair protein RadA [Candidatus Fermentibacteria bacterium]